jgi:hypothetical protein
MTLKIIKKNRHYNNLYEYFRNIPPVIVQKLTNYMNDAYLNKFDNNFKKITSKKQFTNFIYNTKKNQYYKIYYMKLITIDILINKSFSFKCFKTNKVYRSKKSFHVVFQNESVNVEEGLDDIIVYVFDDVPMPFFVCIGGGGRGSALENEIYLLYYYNSNLVYSFNEIILKSNKSKILLCNKILSYYNTNIILPSNNICTTYGYLANMGHTYWNEMSAFKILLDLDLLKYIDKFIIGPYDYYNLYDYLLQNNYSVIRENKIENINSILNNNSLIFKYNNLFMFESLKTFVLEINKLDDEDELLKIQNVKNKYHPIITFNLRGCYRHLYNQEEIFITIINHLLLLYPNMFIIFDGYVKNKNVLLENYTTEHCRANEKIFDEAYYGILNKIISHINTTNYVSLIGENINKELAWLDISDYGILQVGSGNTNYGFVMNKKYICFGKNDPINDECLTYTFQELYRENKDFSTYINKSFINFELYKKHNLAFYIDWKIIFLHIIRDLILLEKHNYLLPQVTNIDKYWIYMNFDINLNSKLNINDLLNKNIYDSYNTIKGIINTTT